MKCTLNTDTAWGFFSDNSILEKETKYPVLLVISLLLNIKDKLDGQSWNPRMCVLYSVPGLRYRKYLVKITFQISHVGMDIPGEYSNATRILCCILGQVSFRELKLCAKFV